MNDESYTKWVGLIQVSQARGIDVLGAERGAHVTALAWCSSEPEFRALIAEALAAIGLNLVDAEEVETCEARMRRFSIPAKFLSAMEYIGPDHPVEFMDFHTFPIND